MAQLGRSVEEIEVVDCQSRGPGECRERSDKRSKTPKLIRFEGARIWRGLLVVALKTLHGDRRRG